MSRLTIEAREWLIRLIGTGMVLYAEYMILNVLFPDVPLK